MKFMEFVCIEAKTFMEMNEALEAVVKKCVKHAEVAYPVWTTGLTTKRLVCLWMPLLERCCSFAERGPFLTVI